MNRKLITCSVVIFIIFAFLGGRWSHRQPITNSENDIYYQYPLLAKRLFIENPNDRRINFSTLRRQLNDYFIDNRIYGSVYFEFLPTGTSVRVNGDVQYRAASLMKLAVAMESMKAAELGQINLDSGVKLKEDWFSYDFGNLYKEGVDYEITIEDLIITMLQKSDNTAAHGLIELNQNLSINDRVLGALDVEFKSDDTGIIFIGTRAYSSILKCLYFACYNNFTSSQEILNILTTTNFADRIQAGLPDDTLVAHKIGIFEDDVQSDCGIIYEPDKPYILCIMIEGTDSDDTNKHFEILSKLVYDQVIAN